MGNNMDYLRPAIDAAINGDQGPLDEEINTLTTVASVLGMVQDALSKRQPTLPAAVVVAVADVAPTRPKVESISKPKLATKTEVETIGERGEEREELPSTKNQSIRGDTEEQSRRRLAMMKEIRTKGPQTVAELAKVASVSYQTVFSFLPRHLDTFEKGPDGKWGLTTAAWQEAKENND